MKTLIVYYSLDGNTRFIAESISQAIGADLLELRPKKDLNPNGIGKYFWGGRQVFVKEKPELLPMDKDLKDYERIIFGTPVWAWSYAPALATFFSNTNINGKKIALFCCSGGGKGKTLDKMKEQLSGNEIIGEIDFIEPLRCNKEQNAEKARRWSKEVCL